MIFLGHIGITTAIVKKYEELADRDKKDPIDYRFVFIGAILPDLIDKPVEILVNHKFPSFGRMYAHSLLFTVILLAIGMLHNFMHKNIFVLGICSLIHIGILDGMWLDPKVFFFPAYGVNLIGINHYVRIPYISAIYRSPYYLIIGEILGAFLLCKQISWHQIEF